MSLSEYLKTRLEYAAMRMQFQAPGSAVAQFDSWDFNLKTATIFSLFDKSAFTPAPRFKLNLGYPLLNVRWLQLPTFLKVAAFPCGSCACQNGVGGIPGISKPPFACQLQIDVQISVRGISSAGIRPLQSFSLHAAFAKHVYFPDSGSKYFGFLRP